MAQAARTCLFTFIPSMDMRSVPWMFLFLLAFHFLLFLFFFPFLMTDGDSMTINNLRDSANGTFVALDDYLPLTGHEPNTMELTNATDLNDAISSNFIDFQDSLVHTAPSSDLHMDDDIRQAARRSTPRLRRLPPCGRCECQSVVSVSHGRSNRGTCGKDDCWGAFARKFLITNSLQLKQKKNGVFYGENHCANNRIFVKFINNILQKEGIAKIPKFSHEHKRNESVENCTKQSFISNYWSSVTCCDVFVLMCLSLSIWWNVPHDCVHDRTVSRLWDLESSRK